MSITSKSITCGSSSTISRYVFGKLSKIHFDFFFIKPLWKTIPDPSTPSLGRYRRDDAHPGPAGFVDQGARHRIWFEIPQRVRHEGPWLERTDLQAVRKYYPKFVRIIESEQVSDWLVDLANWSHFNLIFYDYDKFWRILFKFWRF